MRITEEQHRKDLAAANLAVILDDYQREHRLTTAEMMHAVSSWTVSALKHVVLRAEQGA